MRTRLFVPLAVATATSAALAQPLTTAFTYQGELRSAGTPAQGLHDLRVRLYDAALGGGQIGPTLCADNVSVVDGRFTVSLDFGNQFASGDSRYLEIDVRSDAGLNCTDSTGFTTLGPRQPLTLTPFAAYAVNARSALDAENSNALGGQPSTFYLNASNLNAGTLPSARLSGAYSNPLTFSGAVTVSNPLSAFSGSGSGLVGLNAANVSTGILTDARLSTNIPRLDAGNTWLGANILTNASNQFAGDGGGLTNLNTSNLNGQITGAQLADNAVDTFKIAPNAIINSDISDNSISNTKIVNGTITGAKISDGTITAADIGDGSIGNADLQGNVIASVNIIDGAVAGIDIAPGAVTGGVTGPIADNTVASIDILDGTITTLDIANDSIGAADIAPDAVGASEIAPNAVGSGDLASDAASLARVSGGALQSNGTRIGLGAAPTANEFFVNGRIESATGLTTAGTITAAEFVFANPFPRVYSIGPYDFTRLDGGVSFGENNAGDHSGDPFLFSNTLIVPVSCAAPVHLPDEAVVSSVEALILDDSTVNMTVQLLRRAYDESPGGTMAQVLSSGAVADSIRSFTDNTISAPTIDNGSFQYYVRVAIPAGNGALHLKGVIIRYRIPRALP